MKLHYGVTVGDEEYLYGYQPGQTITCAKNVNVRLTFHHIDGTEDAFRVSSSVQLRTVMREYAKRKGKHVEVLRFIDCGDRVNEVDTVAMMYGNRIDVATEQKGC